MAIKKISEFVSATPTSEDKILFEHNGAGKSATISDVRSAMGLSTVATSGNYNDLSNKPSLATVATSGSYTDLSNKPTIPNVRVGFYISDLNQATTSGFYRTQDGQANSPNSYGQLIVCQGGGDTITQIYGDYASGILYTRSGNTVGGGGAWTPWKRLWMEGDRITGAVFNDLADAIPVGEGDVLEAGYCYGFDGEHYTKTSEYMQKSYIGIHSDTYGFKLGHEEGKEKLNVAVSGFVLAYVDKEYEVGTPLTCTSDGHLTEIKLEDKIKYPERVVATYWKNEPNEEWGPEDKKVRVKGRRWVKVK